MKTRFIRLVQAICLSLVLSLVVFGGTKSLACVPDQVANTYCGSGSECGSRCGRIWVNNSTDWSSDVVNITSASGYTAVNAYGVVKTCKSSISSSSYSSNISPTYGPITGSVARIDRTAVKSTYSHGCPIGPNVGLSIDNASAFASCSHSPSYCVLTVGFISYWQTSSNGYNQSSTVVVSFPDPKPKFSVSGGTTTSAPRLLAGDKITFTHTGSAVCTEASCTTTVSFKSSSGTNLSSIKYANEQGKKSIKATNEVYTIKESDYGNNVCRQVSWSYKHPDGETGDVTGQGNNACVFVPKPTLDVSVTATSKADREFMSPDSVANFTHSFKFDRSGNYTNDVTATFTPADGTSNNRTISSPGGATSLTLSYGTIPATGAIPSTSSSESGTITESHKATQDHVGGRVCRQVNYNIPKPGYTTLSGSFSGNSTQACVAIPYQYELTPHVEVGGKTSNIIVVPGTTDIPITGTLKNSDATKSLNNTEWILAQFRLESGQQPGAMGYDSDKVNATHPSGLFNPNGSYLRLGNGTGSIDYNEIKKVITETFTVPADAKVGQKYCFALSVKPYKAEWKDGQGQVIHDNWRHSLPICVIVAKQPVTQVHGAGLILPQGGAKGYLTTRPTNDKYGSWIEYDILSAKETETAVASNAGHLIQYGLAADALWHQLTIANTPTKGQYGSNLPSNRATVIKDHYINLAKSKTITGHSPEIDLTSYTPNSGLNYLYHSGSNLRLKGTLPAGKSLVIIQDSGDVIIEQNLIYAKQSQFGSARDYSQLIIIANNGNIIVNDNVSRIDAWLVALGKDANQGRLKTCQYSEVSVNRCANQLVVNGPVIVDYIDLMRTYGNDVTSLGAPAEVFNFRPDAYLWSLGNNSGIRPVYETTYSRELPPRY